MFFHNGCFSLIVICLVHSLSCQQNRFSTVVYVLVCVRMSLSQLMNEIPVMEPAGTVSRPRKLLHAQFELRSVLKICEKAQYQQNLDNKGTRPSLTGK